MSTWTWQWEALLFLAQFLGIFVTVVAIIVAILPRNRMVSVYVSKTSSFEYTIVVTNGSSLPNTITEIGIYEHLSFIERVRLRTIHRLQPLRHAAFSIRDDNTPVLPICILPCNSVSFNTTTTSIWNAALFHLPSQYADEKRSFSVYAKDSCGKIYKTKKLLDLNDLTKR